MIRLEAPPVVHMLMNLPGWMFHGTTTVSENFLRQAGWWLSHPSGKYESQLGWLFPIYGHMKNVPNHQPETDQWHWCVEILDHLTENSNAIPIHQIKAQTVDFHLGRYPRIAKTKYSGKIWENHGNSYPEVNYQTIKWYEIRRFSNLFKQDINNLNHGLSNINSCAVS